MLAQSDPGRGNPGSPYVGPVPFSSADRDRFFGRVRETRILTGMVMSCRAVLLFAQSGAGKSSLVEAGLFPALEGPPTPPGAPSARIMRVLGTAKVSIRPPTAVRDARFNPFVYSTLASLELDPEPARLIEAACDGGLERMILRRIEALAAQGGRLVPNLLIFDQFEELFTHFQEHWQARPGFFMQLASTLARAPSLHVLFSMREDFIAELTPFASLMPEQLDARFRLERLSLAAALDAARAPAYLAGRPFAEGVAEKLVLNLARLRTDPAAGRDGGRIDPAGGRVDPMAAPGGMGLEMAPGESADPAAYGGAAGGPVLGGVAGGPTMYGASTGGPAPVYGEWVEPMHLQIVCQRLWNATAGEPAILERHVEQNANVDQVLSEFYEEGLAAVLAAEAALAGAAAAPGSAEAVPAGAAAPESAGAAARESGGANASAAARESGGANASTASAVAAAGALAATRVVAAAGAVAATGVLRDDNEDALPAVREQDLRVWFETELLTPSGVRALVVQDAQRTGTLPNRAVRILDTRYLIRPVLHGRARAYELSHDRLIEPLLRSNRAWWDRYPLARAADAWARSTGSRDAMLLSGPELEAARTLLAASPMLFSEDVERFVAESLDALERRAAAEAERRLLEETERRRQEEVAREKERRKVLTLLTLVLLIGAIFAVAAAIQTFHLYRRADSARLEADKSREEAESALDEAEEARAQAEDARNEEESARKEADALRQTAEQGWSRATLESQKAREAQMTAEEKEAQAQHELLRNRDANWMRLAQDYLARDPAMAGAGLLEVCDPENTPSWIQVAVDVLRAPRARYTLTGYHDGVLEAAFSGDGSKLLTASADRTARVWNVAGKGQPSLVGAPLELRVEPGRDGGVSSVLSVRFSPDGKWMALATADGRLRLSGLEGERSTVVLPGHSGLVTSIVFSADSRRMATSSIDGTAIVWRLDATPAPTVLKGHTGPVNRVEFSPDGARVVTASSDRTLRLWQVDGTGVPVVFTGHTEPVYSGLFSPDGASILSASRDGTARLWRLDGTVSGVFAVRSVELRSAVMSRDGRFVAASGADDAVRLWSTDGAGPVLLAGHEGGVRSVEFSPDGARILTVSEEGTARIWSGVAESEPLVLRGHQTRVLSARFNPDGTSIATAAADHTVKLWPTGELGNTLIFRGSRAPVFSASMSPDGAWLATGGYDGIARVWSLNRLSLPALLKHGQPITSLAFSPSGWLLATGSLDGTTRVYRVDQRERPLVFWGRQSVLSVRFSPDGKRVLSGSSDGKARIWPLDGRPPLVLEAGSAALNTVDFSPDGRQVATGSVDGTVRLFRSTTDRTPLRLMGHRGPVTSVRFRDDSPWLLSTSTDGTARIWSTETGAPIHTLSVGREALFAGDFDPAGPLILMGAAGGAVTVRAMDGTGEPYEIGRHADAVHSVSFGPGGRQILTASEDGSARLWQFSLVTGRKVNGWPEIVARLRMLVEERIKVGIPDELRVGFVPDIRYPDQKLGCRGRAGAAAR